MKKLLIAIALILAPGCAGWSGKATKAEPPVAPPLLTLQKDDHICIIGNSFADRMQHSGYLETLIHAKYPDLNLVFRNLGFSGDELTLRLRSEGFGSTDDWLKKEKADVILAFFGYNESYKGQDGLEPFKKDLQKFIQDTVKQNYSGKGPPRLVLFSPIAAEPHTGPNYPDVTPINQNVKLYAAAMAEVAEASNIPIIDLITPSERLFAAGEGTLTLDGVHLRDEGYMALSSFMFQALFHDRKISLKPAQLEKLRAAVNDKNRVWFSRYRTMDGYNVYGGRSHLEFDGVKNRDTMQREMEMRDVMTANRDKRIWAIAKGGDLEVKDDNLPPPVEVKTNKPGANPDGSHVFLSGEEAIKHMKLPPGCKVNLFASEEKFPELSKPVQMAFDTKGRLWVAVWPNYPERTPLSKDGDKLLVFEDTNGDGKADKMTTFIDNLNCPTGFQFFKDGVVLVQAPDVWYVRDTDGDGKADFRERILNGLDSADSHHTANALALDPGGAIYLSDGVFHRTQIENAWGPPVRNLDAEILRFEPRTLKIETYISYGFANPHGRVFDYWGNDLVTDATGNNTYFGPAFSGHIDYPHKHSELKQFWNRPSRPCPGTGILSSRHFPEEFQGNFLNINVIGFQGIYRVKVKEDGSGLWGETLNPPLVESDDPNFRPIALDVAPDGSIYFLDWHNPIIGHMQHHIRDPNRDHTHGRIYRITYPERPLEKPVKIAGEPVGKLLDLLKEPENNVRTRAKIELGAHPTGEVLTAVAQWVRQFDAKKIEDQHHLLEALWVHQWHNAVNEPLLRQLLASPEPRARAQAVRVLCYWRDRVGEPLDAVKAAINDPSPRVRLEALRAASFFKGEEVLDMAHEALRYETDYYLNYTFKETARQLKMGMDGVYLPKDPVALGVIVKGLSDSDLIRAAGVEQVLAERLERPGLDIKIRTAALTDLTNLRKTDSASEALAALQRLDAGSRPPRAADDVGYLLASLRSSDLARSRPAFTALTAEGKAPAVRRAAFAALVAADGKPETVWNETAADPLSRAALIDSIILQSDTSYRTMFTPLLFGAISDAKTPGEVRRAALAALPLLGAESAKKSFGVLASHLKDGTEPAISARALLQLPRDAWDQKQAKGAAEAALAWARTVPPENRTTADFIQIVQAGTELAATLRPADALRIRKELAGLGVRVFALKSVREQMRYDVPRIVVEADKPFEIVFENLDMMPHNLTILQPGSREEIGLIADKMPPNPDDKGRLYVPNDKRVIAATKMIEPAAKETLRLTAPKTPGDYEYVCTYPDHWKTMFGQLRVVENLEAYLQSGAANPPPDIPSKASAVSGHSHAP